MSPCFVLFGFGYTAKALAPKLVSQGFQVIGTKRHILEADVAKNGPGIKLIEFDCPSMKDYLAQSTHLLVSIPPAHSLGDPVLIKYAGLIKKQAPHLQWLGYLSSTGVYGDHQGQWVNEETLCRPHTPTGIARLTAEQNWLSYATTNQLPLHIFRLSGIYGPKRNAIERLCLGKKHSVFKEGQVFCRIHVDDIVSVLLASIHSINPLSIYNVSDDEPAATHSIDNYAATLLNIKPPPLIPFAKASLSPMEQEFYTNNRRVSNLKIKKELNITLEYPTFRKGLSQIWNNDFTRFINSCKLD